MKSFINILFLAAAATMFTACTSEVDDVFDKSSSERIEEAIQNDKDVLTSAPNGWIMRYYGNPATTYGGYNVLCKFSDDNTVTVASELYSPESTATSHYKLEQSAGVVLSFDEYNEIFHYFSDPKNPDGIGQNGKGFEGDLEFRIVEATPERVVMTGKKRNATIVMEPVAEGTVWADYISSVQDAAEEMSYSKYAMTIGGKEVSVSVADRTLYFSYNDDAEEVQEVKAQYIQTPTGFLFYEPVEVNGMTISSVTFDRANERFTVDDDNSTLMIPVVPPISEQFAAGEWFFAYSQMSPLVQQYFAQAYNGSAAEGEQIRYMYIGNTANGFAFCFQSGNYAGYLGYNYRVVDDDKITLAFALTGNNNGVYYYNNCGYNYITAILGGSGGRTFKLEADNEKAPSVIKLTDVDNPDIYMTVTSSVVYYPFEN